MAHSLATPRDNGERGQLFSAMQSIACQAMDHQVAFVLDPAPGQHLLEQGLVEAAPGFVIDVLWHGPTMAQLCCTHAAVKPLGLSTGGLAINEKPQPFGVAEPGGAVL